MALIPESAGMRAHMRHNLHELAWRTVPATEPATLVYFMADYVDHLAHHLRQVLGEHWL